MPSVVKRRRLSPRAGVAHPAAPAMTTGLAFAFPLHEAVGDFVDVSGAGVGPAVAVGGPTRAVPMVDGVGVALDGSDDRVFLDDSPAARFGQKDWTVAVRVRHAASGVYCVLAKYDTTAFTYEFAVFFVNTILQVRVLTTLGTTSNFQMLYAPQTYEYDLVVRYEAATRNVTLSADGAYNSASFTLPADAASNAGPLVLANDPEGVGRLFGDVGHFYKWDRRLSDREVEDRRRGAVWPAWVPVSGGAVDTTVAFAGGRTGRLYTPRNAAMPLSGNVWLEVTESGFGGTATEGVTGVAGGEVYYTPRPTLGTDPRTFVKVWDTRKLADGTYRLRNVFWKSDPSVYEAEPWGVAEADVAVLNGAVPRAVMVPHDDLYLSTDEVWPAPTSLPLLNCDGSQSAAVPVTCALVDPTTSAVYNPATGLASLNGSTLIRFTAAGGVTGDMRVVVRANKLDFPHLCRDRVVRKYYDENESDYFASLFYTDGQYMTAEPALPPAMTAAGLNAAELGGMLNAAGGFAAGLNLAQAQAHWNAVYGPIVDLPQQLGFYGFLIGDGLTRGVGGDPAAQITLYYSVTDVPGAGASGLAWVAWLFARCNQEGRVIGVEWVDEIYIQFFSPGPYGPGGSGGYPTPPYPIAQEEIAGLVATQRAATTPPIPGAWSGGGDRVWSAPAIGDYATVYYSPGARTFRPGHAYTLRQAWDNIVQRTNWSQADTPRVGIVGFAGPYYVKMGPGTYYTPGQDVLVVGGMGPAVVAGNIFANRILGYCSDRGYLYDALQIRTGRTNAGPDTVHQTGTGIGDERWVAGSNAMNAIRANLTLHLMPRANAPHYGPDWAVGKWDGARGKMVVAMCLTESVSGVPAPSTPAGFTAAPSKVSGTAVLAPFVGGNCHEGDVVVWPEPTTVYYPTTKAGLIGAYDLRAPYLFTDTARTTPAADGEVVLGIEDRSGLGNHHASTDGTGWTYRANRWGGKGTLQCPLVQSQRGYQTTTNPAINCQNLTVFTVHRNHRAYNSVWFGAGGPGFPWDQAYCMSLGHYFKMLGNTAIDGEIDAFIDHNVPQVSCVRTGPTATKFWIGEEPPQSVNIVTGATTVNGYTLGNYKAGLYSTLAHQDEIAAQYVYDGILSDQDVEDVLDWMRAEFSFPYVIPYAANRIVCVGDSNTFGVGLTGATIANAWPQLLQVQMGASWTVLQYGIPGAGIGTHAARAETHYSASATRNVVIISLGVNNATAGADPAVMRTALIAQCSTFKALGYFVIVTTVPLKDGDAAANAILNVYNPLLKSEFTVVTGTPRYYDPNVGVTWADGLWDLQALLDETTFPDNLHWGNANHQLVADDAEAILTNEV